MSIKAAIFYPELKRLVGETDELRLSGSTVGEALDDLVGRFPDAEEAAVQFARRPPEARARVRQPRGHA